MVVHSLYIPSWKSKDGSVGKQIISHPPRHHHLYRWYILYIWLVVGPPLWKIWLRQLGWWQKPNINGKITLMATKPPIFIGGIYYMAGSFEFYPHFYRWSCFHSDWRPWKMAHLGRKDTPSRGFLIILAGPKNSGRRHGIFPWGCHCLLNGKRVKIYQETYLGLVECSHFYVT